MPACGDRRILVAQYNLYKHLIYIFLLLLPWMITIFMTVEFYLLGKSGYKKSL